MSLKGYNLTIAKSNNTEQIDSMRVMIKEMRIQNTLLTKEIGLVSNQIEQTNNLIDIYEGTSKTQHNQLGVLLNSIK